MSYLKYSIKFVWRFGAHKTHRAQTLKQNRPFFQLFYWLPLSLLFDAKMHGTKHASSETRIRQKMVWNKSEKIKRKTKKTAQSKCVMKSKWIPSKMKNEWIKTSWTCNRLRHSKLILRKQHAPRAAKDKRTRLARSRHTLNRFLFPLILICRRCADTNTDSAVLCLLAIKHTNRMQLLFDINHNRNWKKIEVTCCAVRPQPPSFDSSLK